MEIHHNKPGLLIGAKWGVLCALTLLVIQPISWWTTTRFIYGQPQFPPGVFFTMAAWIAPLLVVAIALTLAGSYAFQLLQKKEVPLTRLSMLIGLSMWLLFSLCWVVFAKLAYSIYGGMMMTIDYRLLSEIVLNSAPAKLIPMCAFSYAMCQNLKIALLKNRQ